MNGANCGQDSLEVVDIMWAIYLPDQLTIRAASKLFIAYI